MKRLLAVFLAVCFFSAMILTASAAELTFTDTGKTVLQLGDWMYERINNDTQWELDEYIGDGGEVIVPRILGDCLIVRLGDHCFSNNQDVTSVITSSPLWTIGEYCFVNCTALENFECNYALNTIETGAFSGTSALKSINLETSVVTEIMPYTFLNSGIEEITLPDTCEKIDNYAFGQCASLTKITIPASVTEICEDAFKDSDKVVIYCCTDSAAHQYAEEKGVDYVLLDAPVEVAYVVGDADGDGKITILDATKIQRLLAALVTDPDGMIALRGDSDGNGIDILDATRIQRWLAGFTTTEPIGEEATTSVIPNYF